VYVLDLLFVNVENLRLYEDRPFLDVVGPGDDEIGAEFLSALCQQPYPVFIDVRGRFGVDILEDDRERTDIVLFRALELGGDRIGDDVRIIAELGRRARVLEIIQYDPAFGVFGLYRLGRCLPWRKQRDEAYHERRKPRHERGRT